MCFPYIKFYRSSVEIKEKSSLSTFQKNTSSSLLLSRGSSSSSKKIHLPDWPNFIPIPRSISALRKIKPFFTILGMYAERDKWLCARGGIQFGKTAVRRENWATFNHSRIEKTENKLEFKSVFLADYCITTSSVSAVPSLFLSVSRSITILISVVWILSLKKK